MTQSRKPVVVPDKLLAGEELTAAMVGIGMNFAAQAASMPNIEDTLFAASVEGMLRDDLRVLAVLICWIEVHHARINADRLFRIAASYQAMPRVHTFWAGVSKWLDKDRRFARLGKLYDGERIDLLPVGTDFQIRRRGEDARFCKTPLRVPAEILSKRKADVLQPAQLAKRHAVYRCRVRMGPTYRADMWAILEENLAGSPAELARCTYGSFATAWQVCCDFKVLENLSFAGDMP